MKLSRRSFLASVAAAFAIPLAAVPIASSPRYTIGVDLGAGGSKSAIVVWDWQREIIAELFGPCESDELFGFIERYIP
jgi:hypothetical protein